MYSMLQVRSSCNPVLLLGELRSSIDAQLRNWVIDTRFTLKAEGTVQGLQGRALESTHSGTWSGCGWWGQRSTLSNSLGEYNRPSAFWALKWEAALAALPCWTSFQHTATRHQTQLSCQVSSWERLFLRWWRDLRAYLTITCCIWCIISKLTVQ